VGDDIFVSGNTLTKSDMGRSRKILVSQEGFST